MQEIPTKLAFSGIQTVAVNIMTNVRRLYGGAANSKVYGIRAALPVHIVIAIKNSTHA